MPETSTQKKRRLQKANLKKREKLLNETDAEKEVRLAKRRKHRENDTDDKGISRREPEKNQKRKLRLMESEEIDNSCAFQQSDGVCAVQIFGNIDNCDTQTAVEDSRRLLLDTQKHHTLCIAQTSDEKSKRLALDALRKAKSRAAETPIQNYRRLLSNAERNAQSRSTETLAQKSYRLKLQSRRQAKARQTETVDETQRRLAVDASRQSHARSLETSQQHNERLRRLCEAYAKRSSDIDAFSKAINTFTDKACDICWKQCYPNQIVNYRNDNLKSYLPQELVDKDILNVCHRCNTHLRNNRKIQCPSKAYWNNLDPGTIPDVIRVLSQAEQRMLARIIPFIKVVKFDGRFGQYGFQGHATLFALDIFEVTEKIPQMLPRSSNEAAIIVVTETLENLNRSRDYTINRDRIYPALTWLVENNPLYSDVIIDEQARIEEQDIIRVVERIERSEQNQNDDLPQAGNVPSSYNPINSMSRILRAAWNQGNSVFQSGFAGVQCFAMALSNIVRAAILPPSRWNTATLDKNMIEGDNIYATIHHLTNDNPRAWAIPESGYLELSNLDVIKNDFLMYDEAFSLEYDNTWLCVGNLMDRMNDVVVSKTLMQALRYLFSENKAGIIIGNSKSLGLMKYEDKFYFTDSHSCGPKGAPLNNSNGKGCIIECDTIEELHRICRRVLRQSNSQFSIHYIDVNVKGNVMQMDDYLRNHATSQFVAGQNEVTQQEVSKQASLNYGPDVSNDVLSEHFHVQTSLMAPIDVTPPDVEEVLEGNDNLNEIVRKTYNNIVNVNHEKKAEEFAWFFLFPYGTNGLNEEREVKISPLDYFQSRILGKDTRFQRNDYLFYALSMFEYHRIQSTISACCKKVRDEVGVVKDLHLYMQNLRGSAAYWRKTQNELIAQIRCLGPPTWFLTLSCNDLNWLDMRKALLVADGRPEADPNTIGINETQLLVELYPVVVSRHFMQRFNALMKYIKSNDDVLGGKVKDFWWRIEFQNRGSPHIHMCVWIENAPSFETEGGINLIDEVISCYMPSKNEDPELHDLVKRNQVHHHKNTCYKNNTGNCRFGFNRSASTHTRIISTTSDEFIRNCGRICVLKRRTQDSYVNNYNPILLTLWNGNMDIQPCGTNEAIAHYIAKYICKSEPTDLNENVAQAIRRIRREETNISRQLFKACMRIMKERRVSSCECAFRLCHLPFHQSSRKCVFINTRKPEQRYVTIRFEGNIPQGTYSNIFERYEKRPRQHPNYDFPNMCLLEFAIHFEPDYRKNAKDHEESVDAEIEDVY